MEGFERANEACSLEGSECSCLRRRLPALHQPSFHPFEDVTDGGQRHRLAILLISAIGVQHSVDLCTKPLRQDCQHGGAGL